MYAFNRKLHSHSMYSLLPALCWFTCMLQVLCTPTIPPYKTFNATKDARTICDIGRLKDDVSREKIIRMLGHRTIEERIKVKEEFKKIKNDKYCSNTDIADYLCSSESDSDTRGFSPAYTKIIQDAFKSEYKIYLDDLAECFTNFVWLDGATKIEIFLSIPPNGKAKFKEDYNKAGYRRSLDDELNEIRGDLGHVIKELSKRERQLEKPVDQAQAQKDADLLNAERKDWGDDRRELDRILMETPIKQLNATLFEFRKRHGKPLEKLIDEKMKDDVAKGNTYKDMINYAYNPMNYYARRLLSLNQDIEYEQNVNRIIMIHSGKDLVEIAAAFQALTQRSLIDSIKKQQWSYRNELLRCLAGEAGLEET